MSSCCDNTVTSWPSEDLCQVPDLNLNIEHIDNHCTYNHNSFFNNNTTLNSKERHYSRHNHAITSVTCTEFDCNLSASTSRNVTSCLYSNAASRPFDRDTTQRCCTEPTQQFYSLECGHCFTKQKRPGVLGSDSRCVRSQAKPDLDLVKSQDRLNRFTERNIPYLGDGVAASTYQSVVSPCINPQRDKCVKSETNVYQQYQESTDYIDKVEDHNLLPFVSSSRLEQRERTHTPGCVDVASETCFVSSSFASASTGRNSTIDVIKGITARQEISPKETADKDVTPWKSGESCIVSVVKNRISNDVYIRLRKKGNETFKTSREKTAKNVLECGYQIKYSECVRAISENGQGHIGNRNGLNVRKATTGTISNNSGFFTCGGSQSKVNTNYLVGSSRKKNTCWKIRVSGDGLWKHEESQDEIGNRHFVEKDRKRYLSSAQPVLIRHTRASILRQFQQNNGVEASVVSGNIRQGYSNNSSAAGLKESLHDVSCPLHEDKSKSRRKCNLFQKDKLTCTFKINSSSQNMAEQAALHRPKTLIRSQTDGRAAVSRTAINSGGTTKRFLDTQKGEEKTGSDSANTDNICIQNSKVVPNDAGTTCSNSKATVSLGFLRQTQSQLLKIKSAPNSKIRSLGESGPASSKKPKDGDCKEIHLSKISEKGSRRARTAPVSGPSSEINSAANDKPTRNAQVKSPILRKVSIKENICSDSPPNIQSPRTRKKAGTLGGLSSPEVLSPLTSPTQSEHELISLRYSDKEETLHDLTISDNSKEKSNKSVTIEDAVMSSQKMSKSPTPLPKASTALASLQRRHKNRSPCPLTQESSSSIRSSSRKSDAVTSKSSKTSTSQKVNQFSDTTTATSSSNNTQTTSHFSSTLSSGLSTTTAIDKSTHVHRATQNRSPSLLPVVKRPQTDRTNPQSALIHSRKTDIFSEVTCPSSKPISDQGNEKGPELDDQQKTHNTGTETISSVDRLRDTITRKKTTEPRAVDLQELIYQRLTPQGNKPKTIGTQIDKADHVTSGEETSVMVPSHGLVKSGHEYFTFCMPNEKEVVPESGYSCQECIDCSKPGCEIDDEVLHGDLAETKKLSKVILDDNDSEKVIKKSGMADGPGPGTCVTGLIKCQEGVVTKNNCNSQKSLKENENIRMKELSPNLARKQNGRPLISSHTKSERRNENCDRLNKTVTELKCPGPHQTQRAWTVQMSAHGRKAKELTQANIPTNRGRSVNQRDFPGKTEESRLPRKAEAQLTSKKTVNSSRHQMEGRPTRQVGVTTSDITRRLRGLGAGFKLSSSSLEVKSMTSTRESSVDSRFDDDTASITSDLSSVTSSSVASISQTRSAARGKQVLKVSLTNKDRILNVGSKLKHTSGCKNSPLTEKPTRTDPITNNSLSRRRLNTIKNAKNDSSCELIVRQKVDLQVRSKKASSEKRSTQIDERNDERDITRIITSQPGKGTVTEKGESDSIERADIEIQTNIPANSNEISDLSISENRKRFIEVSDSFNVNKNEDQGILAKQIIHEDYSVCHVSDKLELFRRVVERTISAEEGEMEDVETKMVGELGDVAHESGMIYVGQIEDIHESRSPSRSDEEGCRGEQLSNDCSWNNDSLSVALSTPNVSRPGQGSKDISLFVHPAPRAELLCKRDECSPSAKLSSVHVLPSVGVHTAPTSYTALPKGQTGGRAIIKRGLRESKPSGLYQVAAIESESASMLNAAYPETRDEGEPSNTTQRKGLVQDENELGTARKQTDHLLQLSCLCPRLPSSCVSSDIDKCRSSVCSGFRVLGEGENKELYCATKSDCDHFYGISSDSHVMRVASEILNGVSSSNDNMHVVNDCCQKIAPDRNDMTATSDRIHGLSLDKELSELSDCLSTRGDTSGYELLSAQTHTEENESRSTTVLSLGQKSSHIVSDSQTGVTKLTPAGAVQTCSTIPSRQSGDSSGPKSIQPKFNQIATSARRVPYSRDDNMQTRSTGDLIVRDHSSHVCEQMDNMLVLGDKLDKIMSHTDETMDTAVPDRGKQMDNMLVFGDKLDKIMSHTDETRYTVLPDRGKPIDNILSVSNETINKIVSVSGDILDDVSSDKDHHIISERDEDVDDTSDRDHHIKPERDEDVDDTSESETSITDTVSVDCEGNEGIRYEGLQKICHQEHIGAPCRTPGTSRVHFNNGETRLVELYPARDEPMSNTPYEVNFRGAVTVSQNFIQNSNQSSCFMETTAGLDIVSDSDDSAAPGYQADKAETRYLQDDSYQHEDYLSHVEDEGTDSDSGDACFSAGTETFSTETSLERPGDTVSYGTPPHSCSEVRDGGKEERAEDVEEEIGGECRIRGSVSRKVMSDIRGEESLYKSALESVMHLQSGFDNDSRYDDIVEDYDVGNGDVVDDINVDEVDNVGNDSDDAESIASSESSFQSATSDILMAVVASPTGELFEGCWTSRAGEGMAKLIASDSENLEMACKNDETRTDGENTVKPEQYSSGEGKPTDAVGLKTLMFTSTPKLSLLHKNYNKSSEHLPAVVSPKCSVLLTLSPNLGDKLKPGRALRVSSTSPFSPRGASAYSGRQCQDVSSDQQSLPDVPMFRKTTSLTEMSKMCEERDDNQPRETTARHRMIDAWSETGRKLKQTSGPRVGTCIQSQTPFPQQIDSVSPCLLKQDTVSTTATITRNMSLLSVCSLSSSASSSSQTATAERKSRQKRITDNKVVSHLPVRSLSVEPTRSAIFSSTAARRCKSPANSQHTRRTSLPHRRSFDKQKRQKPASRVSSHMCQTSVTTEHQTDSAVGINSLIDVKSAALDASNTAPCWDVCLENETSTSNHPPNCDTNCLHHDTQRAEGISPRPYISTEGQCPSISALSGAHSKETITSHRIIMGSNLFSDCQKHKSEGNPETGMTSNDLTKEQGEFIGREQSVEPNTHVSSTLIKTSANQQARFGHEVLTSKITNDQQNRCTSTKPDKVITNADLDFQLSLSTTDTSEQFNISLSPQDNVTLTGSDRMISAHAMCSEYIGSEYAGSGYTGAGYAGSEYTGAGYAGSGYTGAGYAGSVYAGAGYGSVSKTNTTVKPMPRVVSDKTPVQDVDFLMCEMDKHEDDLFEDLSNVQEFSQKEFCLHPAEAQVEAQDIRTSLFESGYSSDIKSPDMRSPVKEIEYSHRNLVQIISDELDLSVDNRSTAPNNSACSSDMKKGAENSKGIKIEHLTKKDTNIENSATEQWLPCKAAEERLETFNLVTVSCEKNWHVKAEQGTMLCQEMGEGEEDEISAINSAGYSEKIRTRLSPRWGSNLDTPEKLCADVNKHTTTADEHSEMQTCLYFDTQSSRTEHVCHSATMDAKNCHQEDVVSDNRTLDCYINQDIYQDGDNFRHTDKVRSRFGIKDNVNSECSTNVSDESCNLTTSASNFHQINMCDVQDSADISNISLQPLYDLVGYNSRAATEADSKMTDRCLPDNSCSSSSRCCCGECECTCPRYLSKPTFMSSEKDNSLLTEGQECGDSHPCSQIPGYRPAACKLSAHFQNGCSSLSSCCSEDDASRLRLGANTAYQSVTSHERESALSSVRDNGFQNGNKGVFCAHVRSSTESSRSTYNEEDILDEEGNVVTKQTILAVDDYDCESNCNLSAEIRLQNPVTSTSKLCAFSSMVDKHCDRFEKQNGYALSNVVQDNAGHIDKERGVCSSDVEHNDKHCPKIRSDSSSSSSSLTSSPPMPNAQCRDIDSPVNGRSENKVVKHSMDMPGRCSSESCSCSFVIITSKCDNCNLQPSTRPRQQKSEMSAISTFNDSTKSLNADLSVNSGVTSYEALEDYTNVDLYHRIERLEVASLNGVSTYDRKQDVDVDRDLNTCVENSLNQGEDKSQMEIINSNVHFLGAMNNTCERQGQVPDSSKLSLSVDAQIIDSKGDNSGSQTPRKFSPSLHSEGPPREKSPFILEIVCELLSKVASGDSRGHSHIKPHNEATRFAMSKTPVLTPEEKARANGVRVINKWKSMVKKSRVMTIRESLKIKMAGTDDYRSNLPPPVSPSPPRKYKWARGDSGIWKKVYLDDKDEKPENEQVSQGRTSDSELDLSSPEPSPHHARKAGKQSDDDNVPEEMKCAHEVEVHVLQTLQLSDRKYVTDDTLRDVSFTTSAQISQDCSRISGDDSRVVEDDNNLRCEKMAHYDGSDKCVINTRPSQQVESDVSDQACEETGRDSINISNLFNLKPVKDTGFKETANLMEDETNSGNLDSRFQAAACSKKVGHVGESSHIDPRSKPIDSDIGNATDDDEMANLGVESSKAVCTTAITGTVNAGQLAGSTDVTSPRLEDTDSNVDTSFENMALRNDSTDDLCFSSPNSVNIHMLLLGEADHTSRNVALNETNQDYIHCAKLTQDCCNHLQMLASDKDCTDYVLTEIQKPPSVMKTITSELSLESMDTNPAPISDSFEQPPNQLYDVDADKQNGRRVTHKASLLPVTLIGAMNESTQSKSRSFVAEDFTSACLLTVHCESPNMESSLKREEVIANTCNTDPHNPECCKCQENPSSVDIHFKENSVQLTHQQNSILNEKGVFNYTDISLTKEHFAQKDVKLHSQAKPLATSDQNKCDKSCTDARQEQHGIFPNEHVIHQDGNLSRKPSSYILRKNDLASSQTKSRPTEASSHDDVSELARPDKNVEPEKISPSPSENLACNITPFHKRRYDCKERELDNQKTKKHSWPTVAESLKRFQKSIAGNPPRGHYQRGHGNQFFKSVAKDYLASKKIQGMSCDLKAKPEIGHVVSSFKEGSSQDAERCAGNVKADEHVHTEEMGSEFFRDDKLQSDMKTETKLSTTQTPCSVDGFCLSKTPCAFIKTSQTTRSSDLCSESTAKRDVKPTWSPHYLPEKILLPSPIVSLVRESTPSHNSSHRCTLVPERHEKRSRNLPLSSGHVSDEKYTELSPVPNTACVLSNITPVSEIIPSISKEGPSCKQLQQHKQELPPNIMSLSDHHEQIQQLQNGLLSETVSVTPTASADRQISDDDSWPTTTTVESWRTPTTEFTEHTDVLPSVQVETHRHVPSAKLISVSVWDTHDGDKTLRQSRRLWAQEEVTTLAGISEIEEVHTSHDIAVGKNHDSDLDPSRLQAKGDCKERVRASRSPVRPHTKQRKAPRRSLSLPSGGLSYGDVKILYKDGHFVMMDTSAQKGIKATGDTSGMLEDVSEENERAESTNAMSGDSLHSGQDGSEDCGDAESTVRAEILSLLERGITDPQRLGAEGSPDNCDSVVCSRRNRTTVPMFLSLPRRKGHKAQRPVSIDEAKLWKYYSKSQQSLVSQAELERRTLEEQEALYTEDSGLERNTSFTEAMGSAVIFNEIIGERDPSRDTHNADLCDSGFDDSHQRDAPEGSRTNKSRYKGPGFFQRMLQKRKGSGSEKSLSLSSFSNKSNQKNDLSSSSASLASTCSSNQQASTNKHDIRDSSVGRKISFRGIFKRKNSTDESARKTSTSDEPTSPTVGTLSTKEDTSAVNPPVHSQRSLHWNKDESKSFQEGLLDADEVDSFSHSQIRCKSPKTPLSNASSQSSLYCSLSQDDSDCTPAAFQADGIGHHNRQARTRGRIASGERLSGDSLPEYDLSSPDLRNSDDTLTPRSVSPSQADTSAEGDQTLLASPGISDRLSAPVYQRLTSSPQGGRRRRSREAGTSPKTSPGCKDTALTSSNRSVEMVSRNSNDSGIQNDGNINSSAESIQTTVKLRKSKSPSPTTERPKSDTTVRWADLLEQVMEPSTVHYRQGAAKLGKQPRPKSDIDERMSDEDVEEEGDEIEGFEENSQGGFHAMSESRRALLINANSMGNISTTATAAGSTPSTGTNVSTTVCSSNDMRMMMMQSRESLLSLVELRRPGRDGCRDGAAVRLAKIRRLSTPQPITIRTEKPKTRPVKATRLSAVLTHAHSMPDNLDRLTRQNYLSLIGADAQSITSQQSVGEDSSDDSSEYSLDYHTDGSHGTRSSHVMLAALDQMIGNDSLTYAEALWDHVTMDPDELGFRAGDLIRVTDATDKHWWFGIIDGNEGWFPATFVRLRVNQDVMEEELAYLLAEEEALMVVEHAGNLVKSSNYVGKMQARSNVVNEIISAERDYVKHLRDVVEGYVKQARKRPEMFPREKVAIIFSNIEDIFNFATSLLTQLELSVNHEEPHMSELGQCFLDKVKEFEMYSDYCNNHSAACEELRELYRNKRYRHFFEACRLLQEMIEIPLEGFLLTPVQKICKYHLQLSELLKFTPPDHPDFYRVQGALEAMKKIAKLVNERKRKMESIEKLAAWQLLVIDWEGPDILEGSSELIYSGELNKINHAGWSQERYFFLFDHQLVYCKKDLLKKSSFGFKGRIDMDSCQVVSLPDGRDSQYNVSVRNAWKLHETGSDKWYLLVAKTSAIKQRWLKAFQDERRRVKDDTDNNFNIPNHVKQAVITNFKQKTSLSKPKGKATFRHSNSMTEVISTLNRVSGIATLPRSKNRHKVKSDGLLDKNKKINWFFLGKGKS